MAFLNGKIKIMQIVSIVEELLASHLPVQNANIEDIIALDTQVRIEACELIKKIN